MDDKHIAYLADRLMIEDVITSYAIASDTLNPDIYADIFAPEAQIILPNGAVLADGHDQIVSAARTNQTRFRAPSTGLSIMRHLVSNLAVRIEGDTAQVSHCMLSLAFDEDAKKPEILSLARYEDRMIKRDGRWLIQQRTMHYDWGNDDMARKLEVGPYTPERYRQKPR